MKRRNIERKILKEGRIIHSDVIQRNMQCEVKTQLVLYAECLDDDEACLDSDCPNLIGQFLCISYEPFSRLRNQPISLSIYRYIYLSFSPSISIPLSHTLSTILA